MADVNNPVLACHLMLLRVAGHLPDELMTTCRQWLAEGAIAEVAICVADVAFATDAPLGAEDLQLLHDLFEAFGQDPAILAELEPVEYGQMPAYWFSDTAPEPVDREAGAPPAQLLTDTAVAVVSAQPEALGLWCGWRIPVGDLDVETVPVFLVETVADADLAAMSATVRDALEGVGLPHPQVEVYPIGMQLPPYHRALRGYGELLWAPPEEQSLRLARTFDEIDAETGPRFSDDHPRLSDPDERMRILGYLNGAQVVLVTTTRGVDVVSPQPAPVVPMTVRTDGVFVWPGAVGYYLDQYELAPDPELLAHIRSRDYVPPVVGAVTVGRAVSLLTEGS